MHPQRAVQLGGHQGPDDLQAQPVGLLHAETLGQPATVVVHHHVEPASRPFGADRHEPPVAAASQAAGSKACSIAFWTSSVITMINAVARSESKHTEHARPVDPDRRCPRRQVIHDRQDPVDHFVEVDFLVHRHRQRVVNQRDRRHPSYRLDQRLAALGVGGPAGLQTQQRGDGLKVVLHPVMDLADRGVLGNQRAVAPFDFGDVANQHRSAGRRCRAPPAAACATAPRRHRHPPPCRMLTPPASESRTCSASSCASNGSEISGRVTATRLCPSSSEVSPIRW